MSFLMKRVCCDGLRSVLMLCLALVMVSCTTTGPGAGVRWQGYPALAASTTSFPWLVVKCQLSDVPVIPVGLDTTIQQFFGISGAGYGNLVDYFHDVSYNHASVVGDTSVGWVTAPFSQADLSFPSGRLRSNRGQRVIECLQAIPTDQMPDLETFYGVVVINNAVQDGGACGLGKVSMTVNNKKYSLACLWFDANSLSTQFAAHEFGHGFGMDDSFDDSGRNCGGEPGRYCDPWDIMSAQRTYQFVDQNFVIAGGGPGLSMPGLLKMGWIPAANQRRFDIETGGDQKFTLRSLSRPRGNEPLMVLLNVGGPEPFDGIYTIEYRQAEGWDRGFVTDLNVPAAVRSRGGTVLVHAYRPAGAPTSNLINGAFGGALQPCNTLVVPGVNGLVYHVTVESFDIADGSAKVSVGSGRGPLIRCSRDTLSPDRKQPTRSHARADDTFKP